MIFECSNVLLIFLCRSKMTAKLTQQHFWYLLQMQWRHPQHLHFQTSCLFFALTDHCIIKSAHTLSAAGNDRKETESGMWANAPSPQPPPPIGACSSAPRNQAPPVPDFILTVGTLVMGLLRENECRNAWGRWRSPAVTVRVEQGRQGKFSKEGYLGGNGINMCEHKKVRFITRGYCR